MIRKRKFDVTRGLSQSINPKVTAIKTTYGFNYKKYLAILPKVRIFY